MMPGGASFLFLSIKGKAMQQLNRPDILMTVINETNFSQPWHK